jgi:glycosyltransferase involved in cell wall biosynthesis
MWDRNAEATWSHTPWQLRKAMREIADVVDTGVVLSRSVHLGLELMHARLAGGRVVTMWQQSRLTDDICRRTISHAARRRDCDAVLQIQDLAVLDRPYFVYQDMSFDALVEYRELAGLGPRKDLPPAALERRRQRQLRIYAGATGIFAMSEWLRRSLITVTGIPESKVTVINPGASTGPAAAGPVAFHAAPRRRLLFVGRGDFGRKGGDTVVAALEVLRREVDPEITLTVAGPDVWPLPGQPPEGVRFLGKLPLRQVAELYETHDLFVMPSRQEAFGIVFAEATARGMPCIARDAVAMPEIIQPGRNGALFTGHDPVVLAELIARTLADDALYANCYAAAAETRAWYSWERAATQAVAAITAALG